MPRCHRRDELMRSVPALEKGGGWIAVARDERLSPSIAASRPKCELMEEAGDCLRPVGTTASRLHGSAVVVTLRGGERKRIVETKVRFKRLPFCRDRILPGVREWRGKAGGCRDPGFGWRLSRCGVRRFILGGRTAALRGAALLAATVSRPRQLGQSRLKAARKLRSEDAKTRAAPPRNASDLRQAGGRRNTGFCSRRR